MTENMKKIINVATPAVCAVALVLSVAAFTSTNAANPSSPNPVVSSAPAGQPVDLTYAAEKALPSVVYIKNTQNSKVQTVEYSDPFEDFFSDPFGGFFGRGQGGNNGRRQRQIQTPKRVGAGSGVIISADGYIVTNNHVVDGADELMVTLNDNKEYSARIIGADATTDLALIKIDGKNLPAIQIANSDDVKIGEWVLAVGNPLGLNNTVTAGIVSAKARSMGQGVSSMIQTDAAINQGNSGGALVNTNGALIGINAMIYSQTGSNIGYGFAIPTTIMNKVVDDIKKYGNVQRAMIGIKGSDVNVYVDSEKEKGNEVDLGTMEGIYIAEVVEDGAAADAGLKKDDVITHIDGQKVTKFGELQNIIAQKRPGDKITVNYLRNKSKKSATLTLKNEQGNTKVVKNADLDVLGGNFRAITDAQKEQLNIGYGLEVIKVSGGKLKDAGVPKRQEHQEHRRYAERCEGSLDKQGACALRAGYLSDWQEGLLRSAARERLRPLFQTKMAKTENFCHFFWLYQKNAIPLQIGNKNQPMRQLKIIKSITNRESASLEKYLQEIGKEEMISAEEEAELAQRIRKGDQKALERLTRANLRFALERLTRANLRFVVSVAKQYQNQGMSLPDLINEGNLGLLKAAERFDETRGFKFISYAVWWIRQSILQAISEQSRIVRLPLNQVGSYNKINREISKFEQLNERAGREDRRGYERQWAPREC